MITLAAGAFLIALGAYTLTQTSELSISLAAWAITLIGIVTFAARLTAALGGWL